MTARTALDIARRAAASTTSPDHKRFQTLLARIDKARLRLQAWHEQLPLFAQGHHQRADPVLARLSAARRAWAFELEQLLLRRKWAKADRLALADMICALAGRLLHDDAADADLKDLYNRVAEVDFDTEDQHQTQAMKSVFEAMTGLDLGQEPVESMDDLMRRSRQQMAQQRAQQGAAAGPDADRAAGPHAAKRGPPGQAASAAQRRAQADAARVSQTVREVYRKLASALHPDRAEPGATPAQQAERTDRMARANAAYAAGDLLALLTLQLQIEQVDLAHAAAVTATQVRHFNKLLAEQLDELQAEIDDRQTAFCASYGLVTEQRLDPLKLGLLLQDKLRTLLTQEAMLAAEQRLLRGDAAGAKLVLKRWRLQARPDEPFV